jgi:hypothetical protein
MQECWIEALEANRSEIHRRWEALLRLDRADGPLSDPDNLMHLIDWTFDEVLAEIRRRKILRRREPNPPTIANLRARCHCGHNPLSHHFVAGEQALLEALIQQQAADPTTDPQHRSTAVVELYVGIHSIAEREVELLCSMCIKRPQARRMASPAMIGLSARGESASLAGTDATAVSRRRVARHAAEHPIELR